MPVTRTGARPSHRPAATHRRSERSRARPSAVSSPRAARHLPTASAREPVAALRAGRPPARTLRRRARERPRDAARRVAAREERARTARSTTRTSCTRSSSPTHRGSTARLLGLLERLLAKRGERGRDRQRRHRRRARRAARPANSADRSSSTARNSRRSSSPRHEPPLRAIYQAGVGLGTPARRPPRGRAARDRRRAPHAPGHPRRPRRAAERGLAAGPRRPRRPSPTRCLPSSSSRSSPHFDVGIVFDRPVALNNALGFPEQAVRVPDGGSRRRRARPARCSRCSSERGASASSSRPASPESLAETLESLAADPVSARAVARACPRRCARAL